MQFNELVASTCRKEFGIATCWWWLFEACESCKMCVCGWRVVRGREEGLLLLPSTQTTQSAEKKKEEQKDETSNNNDGDLRMISRSERAH